MSTELATNFIKELEIIQNALIKNNDQEGIYGNGKDLVDCDVFPITHNFSDGLYMRQMIMTAGSIAISAMHHTNHFWFLLSGKVIVQADEETVEHIAPCFTISKPGAKRVIYASEDSIFVNIHKNPSNTEDLDKLEKEIVSMTQEEFHTKNNTV